MTSFRMVLIGGMLLTASVANAGTLIPLPPVPGSTSMEAFGINNANIVAGDYVGADGNSHGFFGTLDGQYTTFVGKKGFAYVRSINDDGYITGQTGCDVGALGFCEYVRKPSGAITIVKRNGAGFSGNIGEITRNERFVGDYLDENFQAHGYYGKGHQYLADLVLPLQDAGTAYPRGYSDRGTVVGYYNGSTQGQLGFVLKTGVASSFQFPDPRAAFTYLEGVNHNGRVVGEWSDSSNQIGQAFLLDPVKNRYLVIDVPNSTWSIAGSINDAGLVVVGSDAGFYVYCPSGVTCPAGAHAVHVRDESVLAAPVQVAICSRACAVERKPED